MENTCVFDFPKYSRDFHVREILEYRVDDMHIQDIQWCHGRLVFISDHNLDFQAYVESQVGKAKSSE